MYPLIESHRATIRALAAHDDIDDVRVFGSVARDDADAGSDSDLLVTLSPGKSGLVLGGLLMDVQELTRRKVDVVTEVGLHPVLRERILCEARPLWTQTEMI